MFNLLLLFIINLISCQAYYFTQKLDHFDINNNSTFKQRFYINENNYDPNSKLGIIYISGENALKESRVNGGLLYSIISEQGGILAALEHRYYGDSVPFNNLKDENMKYLNKDQALYDIKAFKDFLKQKYNINQFIVAGGSYSGSLALWSKQLFKNDYLGAFGSSAPLILKKDFYEYDMGMYQSLGEQCSNKMILIRQKIDDIYKNNRARLNLLKNKLNCNTIKDDVMFMYTMADMVATIVQYNSDTKIPNINSFCNKLLQQQDSEELITIFIDQLNLFLKNQNQTCYGFSNIEQLLNTKFNVDHYFRQWTYQTCNEFGFWQTAPKTNSLRSLYLTESWFVNYFCKSPYFNIPFANKSNNIIDINVNNINNMIITNGQLDPWNQLSLLPIKSKSLLSSGNYIQKLNNSIILNIKGASHVSDMDKLSQSDPLPLKYAKNLIKSQIEEWLMYK